MFPGEGAMNGQISVELLCRMARRGKTVGDLLEELKMESPEELERCIDRDVREADPGTAVRIVGDNLSFYPCLTEQGLRIDPNLLVETGFQPGDEFFLRVNRGRILLEKIVRPAAPPPEPGSGA
jgi:antitoxin component of MazEF toxin-antitoxin module